MDFSHINYTNSSYDTDDVPYCDYNASSSSDNKTMSSGGGTVTVVLVTSYALICFFGLIGNGLVIYVVMRHAKMKTVTKLKCFFFACCTRNYFNSIF